MSITADAAHLESGHHEPIEVVANRQKLAIWLFIGGDVVSLGALMFTYLYLRGLNTDGHFQSAVGFNFNGLTTARANYLINNATPHLQFEKAVAAGLNWAIPAVVVLSAALLWWAEHRFRQGLLGARSLSLLAYLSAAVVLVAALLEVKQMRSIPQYFAVNNDSQLFVYTSYGSCMLALGTALIIHALLLAFLGAGVGIRAQRGAINFEKWHQIRLVRFFWVWVAVMAVVTALMTTVFH